MKLFTKTSDKKLNTNRRSGGGGNFSCRHPKLWEYIKSNVKAFFITGAITFVVSASATTILHSRQVRYKNDKSVEQAINELYQKAEPIKMKKMGCNGCIKIDYLESTGTQYIDTLYYSTDLTKVDIWYYNIGYGFVYGARTSAGVKSNSFLSGSSQFTYELWSSFSNQNVYIDGTDVTVNQLSHLVNKKSGCYLNDKLIYQYNNIQTFTGEYSLFIFGMNNANVIDKRQFIGRIYSVQIYNDNTIVHDYVPVLDANDRPCLFDKVSKTCFYNQGTGEFLYG